jgi:Mn-dependent DtxR family transcriptional regulator
LTKEKTILQTVYVKSLRRGRSKTSDIVSSLQLAESSVLGSIKSMARKGFLRFAAPNVFLTDKGWWWI